MPGIVTWFTTHWTDIAQIVVGVIGVASIVVRLTPTLKDDNILAGVVKFLSKWIALNKTTVTIPPTS